MVEQAVDTASTMASIAEALGIMPAGAAGVLVN
jgi:dihydroxyacid dehydratase/phosphogluconate dehydratase